MDDKGEIISSCDVDENLTLQMWTKGMAPRVVILNKNQDKKKFIRPMWFENRDRKLSIKGKKRFYMIDYALSDLLPTMQRILSEYAVYTTFKAIQWRFAVTLERVLHAPAIIFDPKEFAILSEEKRSRLWIADLTGEEKGEGMFRAFFPVSDREKDVLSDARLAFSESRCSVDDLFKTGAVRKLNGADMARWYRPVRIMAAAMLMGFSYCEEDGAEFTDELWRAGNFERPLSFKLNDPKLMGLGRKFVAYTRHFDILDQITVRASLDSDKELLDDEYARKRRLSFPPGALGQADTTVTFFERDGMMALGCKPKMKSYRSGSGGLYYASPPQKSAEKQELIYTFPSSVYERALTLDSLGGAADDFFTIVQLTSAKIFEAWCANLTPYISYFAGI